MKRIILIVICFPVFVYLLLALYVASYLNVSTSEKADVAIILGAKSYKDKIYNPCLYSRAREAERLYRKNLVKNFIPSGGADLEDNTSEAETMKKMLLDHKIASTSVFLEDQATSTYENINYSLEIMKKNNFKTAIIVSEPFHMARANLIAKSFNMDATYESADDSPCWNRWKYLSRYFLKEPVAIAYYVLRGRIKLSAFF